LLHRSASAAFPPRLAALAGLLIALLTALQPWGRAEPVADTGRTAEMRVGGVTITVEIADTEPMRRRGLMGRASLAPDHGMLFVYPNERRLAFWMKDTPLDLDIGFFDAGGRLLNAETMQAYDTTRRHRSAGPARYALEMNAGWFARHGLGRGARIEPIAAAALP
jgi:uncharacterized membrane protein (UPF0127 family)